MAASNQYEISLPGNAASQLNRAIRVRIFNRSLKPAILEWLTLEQLSIHEIEFADSYIEFEILCRQELNRRSESLKRLLNDTVTIAS